MNFRVNIAFHESYFKFSTQDNRDYASRYKPLWFLIQQVLSFLKHRKLGEKGLERNRIALKLLTITEVLRVWWFQS